MADLRITSLASPRIKELLQLRRARHAGGEILIDGVREISRAVQAGLPPLEAYYCDEYLKESEGRELLASIRKSGARIFETTGPVFEKLRYGDRTGGLVAVAARPITSLEQLKLKDDMLLAVLEGLEKPGNLGAILRSADGAGINAVLAIQPVFDIYNANAIRASIGTIFAVPTIEVDVERTFEWLKAHDFHVVAASPDARRVYSDCKLTGRTAILLGSESSGISSFWDQPEVTRVRIPMTGIADSLNVAATAAILFYEAARQRTLKT